MPTRPGGIHSTDIKETYREMRRRGKRVLIFNYVLQALTLLTAVASLLLYFLDDSRGLDITINHMFQCFGALVVLNIPLFISKKFRCYIPNFISISLYVFAFAHFVLGEIFRAYDKLGPYDKILHTTGGIIFAILSFSVVWLLNNSEDGKVRLSPFFIVLFTFCFTMAVEYVWELIEFGMDRLFGLNMQRWQDSILQNAQIVQDGEIVDGTPHSIPYGNGLKDTMTDMIVNILGCLVVCVSAYVGMKRKPNWFVNKVILTEKQLRQLLVENESEEASSVAADAAAADAALAEECAPAKEQTSQEGEERP